MGKSLLRGATAAHGWYFAALLALSVLSGTASAQSEPPPELVIPMTPKPAPSMAEQNAKIRADGRKAYDAGDFADYLRQLQTLSERLPNHPDVAIRLAAAQARTGNKADALATLAAIAEMGVTVDLTTDPRNTEDFRSLGAAPEFVSWQARMKANAAPLSAGAIWHKFTEPDLLTEDVSYDPKDGSFYVSSVLRHKVLRVDGKGREHLFPLVAPENGWNVLAVEVDPARRVLWISAQAIRGYPGISAEDAGKSRLSAYGLASKRRLYTHEFKPQGDTQAAVGDIALAPNGDLLASDSVQGKIYRVSADRKVLDVLNQPFISPQDIAVTADGAIAFVADYSRGIARIRLDTGEQDWLAADRSIALSGIDGMYLRGHGLLLVQNGLHPPRIVYCALDSALRAITGCLVLERGAEVLGEPTHGVVVGNDFIYLANSGWDKIDENGVLAKGATFDPAVLRRLALPAPIH